MELNKIYNCDCLELMGQMTNEFVDITVTSPPYFNIKQYDNFNKWNTYEDYLEDNKKWFEELQRITKKGGYVFWNIIENISNPTKEGREDLPLLADIIKIATCAGFVWENQIIWQKNNGSQMFGSYPYPTTPIFKHKKESILVFRKKGKREIPKEQKTKCKLEKKRWFEITEDIWNIATEKASKIGHPAPYPIEIPRRLIEIASVHESVIFDPFCGSGTTACAAVELKRNYITCDTSKQYCELANDRVFEHMKQMTLF
jgi:site-specific DNA-methyltransferase (adenine-specific)